MDRLTNWGPFRRLVGLRDQMDRLTQPWPIAPGYFGIEDENLPRAWVPLVDIRETPGTFEVSAELTAIDPSSLDVSVQNNTLTIRGKRKHVETGDDETLLRVERDYGAFARSLTLPRSVKPEDIEAIYKKGVLIISIPKRAEAGPKKIQVNILDE